jgi:hypothetical protein
MSTVLNSTRTGASRAGAALVKATSRPASKKDQSPLKLRHTPGSQTNPKGLAEAIHKQLYPNLYGEDGQPVVKLQQAQVYKPRPAPREEGVWQPAAEFFKARLLGMFFAVISFFV